jgi:magnesium-transporting ATPase (P-type)
MQPNYDAASTGILAMFGAGFFIFIFAITIFTYVCTWKIYEKAGHPGWTSIVPVYNLYIFTKIIGKPGWWTILFFIPCVNIIFLIWGTNLLSKSFGKDVGFTLGLIFLGVIFLAIMAFDKTIQYRGPSGSPLNVNDQIEGIGKPTM